MELPKNHRMVEAGSDLKVHLLPISLPWKYTPVQRRQESTVLVLKSINQDSHNLSSSGDEWDSGFLAQAIATIKQMHQGSLLGAPNLHQIRGAEKQNPLPSQDLT